MNSSSFNYQPKISIIVPVFNPPEPYLRAALQSVLDQTYSHWELCIADDASTLPHVRVVLEEYAQQDNRIKLVFRSDNGHISACSNSALEITTGEFIALLDHDDLLTPDALEEVVNLLNQHPDADLIYSDEDKIDDHNQFREAAYKPDWCPDSFLSRMYTCHLGVYRRSLVHEIGGFRIGFEGSQDYDLVLRLTEKTDKIFHIPKILYHWRMHSASAAMSKTAKPYAYEAAAQALTEALQRRQERGRVIPLKDSSGYYQVRYEIDRSKVVSIIILTRDSGSILHQCLTSVFQLSTYPNYEVIVIDNGSVEAETQKILKFWAQQKPQQFKTYRLDITFNYSQLNNFGVSQATGEYLIFLNNDTKIILEDWIEALVEQTQRPSIGAVGGLLLYPDKTLQNGGFVLSDHQIASPFYQGISKVDDYETFLHISLINNISALSGACLACRRTVFEEVGGFDQELPFIYNDVDFCLKLIDQGYRNVYLPHVRLYHQELKSWDVELTAEQRNTIHQSATQLMQQRWSKILTADPCFSSYFIQKFTAKPVQVPTVHKHQRIVTYPLVSVCIPTYNGEKYLAECLESVLSQTYPHLEIIISDDGSTDNTLAIVQTFKEKYTGNFVIVNQTHLGAIKNWNACLDQTRGKYIKFLFQDDLLEKNCIEELVHLAEQDEKIGLVFSRRQVFVSPEAKSNQYCQEISVYANDISKHWKNIQSIQDGKKLLAVPSLLNHPINKIGEPSTVLIRKSVFQTVGIFDSELNQLVDVEMWFRIMSQYKIGFVNKSLSQFRIHPDQLSIKNQRQGNSQRDIYKFYQKIVNSSYLECLDSQLKSQLMQTLRKTSTPSTQSPVSSLNFTKTQPNLEKNSTPFWSVMIPSYNGSRYLEYTLKSILNQAPSSAEMQIEVVDDCSPDEDIEALVQQLAGDRISFHRHPQNLGLIGNWNNCIQRAKGKWVHILHQDDFVLPGFYQKLRELLEKEPQAGAGFCRHYYVDSEGKQRSISALEQENSGIISNWIERISVTQRVQFASIVVQKNVYEKLGGFCLEAGSAADWEMWKRIAAYYPVVYEPQPLACYRLHSNSETSRLIAGGENIIDTLKSIEISHSYLPPEKAEILSKQAKEHYAFYALNTAKQMLNLEDDKSAVAQIKAALQCSQSQAVKDAIIQLFSRENVGSKDFNQILTEVTSLSKQYYQNPQNQSVLEQLRQIRQTLAQLWLNTPFEQLDNLYTKNEGKVHHVLLNSGIKDEPLTETEQLVIHQWIAYLSQGLNQPNGIQHLLATMLYCYPHQFPHEWYKNAPIPNWFVNDYLTFMLTAPHFFQAKGEVEGYSSYLMGWVDYLHSRIFNDKDSKTWQNIAQVFLQKMNGIPLYFSHKNLRDLYIKRAQIMELALESHRHKLDYIFPQRAENRDKIRLGILSTHFNPQTETYSTLPVFEHLDRNQFEIILYTCQESNHPLHQYCQSRADRGLKLPQKLSEQVKTIRGDDLDILLIGTNVTAVTHSVTLLALHRLARIQVTSTSSCVTTGMRNIDYYLSGNLTESSQASHQYSEKLAVIDGTAHCFNYYAIPSEQPTVHPQRSDLKLDQNTVVFMSGANFYKIIPELRETWAKILAKVPNSVLILYPFNPNWTSHYPRIPFINSLKTAFERYNVKLNRLMILDTQPSRTDIKQYLKLADVYLDSYPFSGVNSLVDPLELGLVPVTQEDDSFRSLMGASLLKSLALNDLITNSEEAYINLAVKLATDTKLRKEYSQKINLKMQQNPSFLDSFSYSKKMESVFKQLFNTWKENQQFPAIPLNTPLNQRNYLSELVHHVNLYALNPSDQPIIKRLRQLRKAMAEYWLTLPPEKLEAVYKEHIGNGYQILLSRGIQHEPLLDTERQFVDKLTQVATGLKHPNSLNCLIAAMLYYVPGKMLVRDAEKRLPHWLIKDYKTVFENQQALEKVEQTLASAQVKSTPETLSPNHPNLNTQAFQNRLQGCLNLYYIDPSNSSVVEELRQIRRQLAEFWLNLSESELESVAQSSVGKCFKLFDQSDFIREPLTQAEQEFYQQLNHYLKTQKTLNFILAARLYSPLEELPILKGLTLPSWF